ncbi:MAG: hypothetical protein RJB19_1023, partial [Pseudomonadota bacterium]
MAQGPAEPTAQKNESQVVEQTVLLYAAGKKIYARSIAGHFNNWRWAFV